jgi:hypothetical protein
MGGEREAISSRIGELRARIDELERNKPAHGLKPHHVMQIEETEDEIERLEALLERT